MKPRYVEPTTPLGHISAQDIYGAAVDMDMYEWTEDGLGLKVKDHAAEYAAAVLLENVPAGFLTLHEDAEALETMIQAVAERETPSKDEYLENTNDPDEAQRDHDDTESAALRADA